MSKYRKLIVIILILGSVVFFVSCNSYTRASFSGRAGYGLYDDYHRYRNYPYRYGSYGDVHIKIDRNDLNHHRERIRENRPEQRGNVHNTRNRAPSMGRPARAGRGGRR